VLNHHAKQRYLFIACALVAGLGGCEPGGGHAGLGILVALLAMALPRGRPPTSRAVVTRWGGRRIAMPWRWPPRLLGAAGLLQLLADRLQALVQGVRLGRELLELGVARGGREPLRAFG